MSDHNPLAFDDPWLVDAARFPTTGTIAEKLIFLVNYAVLAPSILNTQPWRFGIVEDQVKIFADWSRALPVTDPEGRELTISCGAALLNLRVAMRAFGYGSDVKIYQSAEKDEPLAEIKLVGTVDPSADDLGLRNAIVMRRTNRQKMESRALPQDFLRKLSSISDAASAALVVMSEIGAKRRIVELVGTAEKSLLSNSNYRDELAHWIQQRVSEGVALHDEAQSRMAGHLANMPTQMAGHLPDMPTQPELSMPQAASAGRMFAVGEDATKRHLDQLATAPVMVAVITKKDDRESWIAAGQMMQRVLLLATVAGASASFLNPPIEVPALRSELAKIAGISEMPQVLLRIGYAPEISPTPRRSVGQVIG